MKDVYGGVVVVDADGQATVEVPVWFEALNEISGVSLTPISARARGRRCGASRWTDRFQEAGVDNRCLTRRGNIEEVNVNLPHVRNKLRESRFALIGVILLVVGFLLQIAANWPR